MKTTKTTKAATKKATAKKSSKVPAPAPVPAVAPMTRGRLLSPAERRGLNCVKYLKIHSRRPYGRRGEEGIVKIAREAAHLGNLELDAVRA